MKKKNILLIILLTLIMGFIMYIYISFNGFFVYKIILTNETKKYIKENYKGEFIVNRAVYDFKINGYSCYVESVNSIDTKFRVYKENNKLVDNYEDCVLNLENTYMRLIEEADKIIEDELKKISNKYSLAIIETKNPFLDKKNLELDMKLDISNPPFPLSLILWVDTKNLSIKELENSFKEIVSICTSNNYKIDYYSISLNRVNKDGQILESIYANDINIKDILSDNFSTYLVNYINKSNIK